MKKTYIKPEVWTTDMQEMLAKLGPARAVVYNPDDGINNP